MAELEEIFEETGETLGTTTTTGVPLYAAGAAERKNITPGTMLFIGTEDAIRGKLPAKSSAGEKLQIMSVRRTEDFRKFYDRGENSHIVLLLHRNTARFGEWDDPLGYFFHRVRVGNVSLVFMGENDQENFAALCELDPNISAVNDAGRVFFWNELEGTPKQKIDELTYRIQDSLGLAPAGRKKLQKRRTFVAPPVKKKPWRLSKLQTILGALGVVALFLTLMCSFPPIDKYATRVQRITVPGADRWTAAERETYLAELRKLELERQAVGAERQRIDTVRRKMIEKINDIEELENAINREKRNIVCGLLERRENLLQEYLSTEHALRHIADLRRDISRMESSLHQLPGGSRDQIELQRSINEKKYDLRVWEEGLTELKKVDDELARSDVFSWTSPPEYCGLPLLTAH